MTFVTPIVPSSVGVENVGDDVYRVTCDDAAGRQYAHFMCFAGRHHWKAKNLAVRVRDAGQIDASHWDCYVPYGSEAWLVDGMEATLMDDEERFHRGM